MSNEVKLNTFPDNELEAIAMLYVQNQDLSGKSPEELLVMYYEAYDKMRLYSREHPEQRRYGWTKG